MTVLDGRVGCGIRSASRGSRNKFPKDFLFFFPVSPFHGIGTAGRARTDRVTSQIFRLLSFSSPGKSIPCTALFRRSVESIVQDEGRSTSRQYYLNAFNGKKKFENITCKCKHLLTYRDLAGYVSTEEDTDTHKRGKLDVKRI